MTEPGKNAQPVGETTGAGCLVRLGWMVFCHVILLVCVGVIASRQGSFLSAADAVFWVVVGLAVWLRRVDITRMGGQTATGRPATLKDWRRYVIALTAVSVIAWAAAHAIAWLRAS